MAFFWEMVSFTVSFSFTLVSSFSLLSKSFMPSFNPSAKLLSCFLSDTCSFLSEFPVDIIAKTKNITNTQNQTFL